MVYILFSPIINRYYVGYTSMQLEERLNRHNTNHKGFTGRANDWKSVYNQAYTDKSEAIKMEKRIKKRGAKRFVEDKNCG